MLRASITSTESSKRGKMYTYYHCTKSSKDIKCQQKKYLSDTRLEENIIDIIDNISIPREYYDWAVKRLEQDSQSDIETNRVIKNNFRRNLKKLNYDLERLLKLCVNGTITETDYLTNKERVEKEIVGVEDKLKNFGEELESSLKLTERYIDFLSKVKGAFINGGLEKKKKILRCFGDNFILHNNKLEIEFYPWVQAIKKDQPQTSNIGDWSGKASFDSISSLHEPKTDEFLLWYSHGELNSDLGLEKATS